MARIHTPVTSWKIEITYNAGAHGHHKSFKTLAELRTFFFANKKIAEMLGYVIEKNRKPDLRDLVLRDVQLSFNYTDKISHVGKHFDNVQQLVAFFEEHPELAVCVGYERKSGNQ